MSWQQWLAQRKVHLHTPSKQELEGLRALSARGLADAALPALSADRRFATACNAALQTAKMAIVCSDYRIAAASNAWSGWLSQPAPAAKEKRIFELSG